MATVGLAITNLQQTPAQPAVLLGPRANASPAQGPNHQQDTVTLTGQTGESHSGSGNGSAQFAEAAAFFFAESQSFRAANGSGGNQTAKLPDVPQLPVKTTQQPNVGETQGTATDTQASKVAGAATTTIEATATSASPAAIGIGTGADTPLAELAQLDTTLQQMGINPQSISLFNRMAMLLYSNDPAALRVLVQTLQQGAQQSGATSNAESQVSQDAPQSALRPLLPGQLQGPAPIGSQPQNAQSGSSGGQTQLADAELQQTAQTNDAGQGAAALASPVTAPAVPMPNSNPLVAQAGTEASAGRSPIPLAAQFGELQSLFVSAADAGAASRAAGGILDVTA